MTPFKAKTSDHIEEINNYLESWLPESQIPPKNLHQAMNYSVMNGGKRIMDHKMLLPAAASIELLHSFSLVHDDLPCMDDDDLRRGQPATHKAFDEATAVLAADALLSLAFEILSSDLNFNGTKEINASLISLLYLIFTSRLDSIFGILKDLLLISIELLTINSVLFAFKKLTS